MSKQTDRPVITFSQVTSINYPILVIGGVVVLCLVAGLIAAFLGGQTLLSLIILFSLIGTSAFLWFNYSQWKRIHDADRNRGLIWDVALPESQRAKLGAEVTQLSRILEIPQEQISDLLSAYVVAEDLALRQIQQEARLPLARHVSIGRTPFDAVLVKQDLITCVEVTFVVTPHVPQQKIDVILGKITSAKKAMKQLKVNGRLRLLLVIVTQLDQASEAELRSTLVKKFANTPVDVDIRLLDFETLQQVYAVE